MTVKVFATCTHVWNKEAPLTVGNIYPVVKITHPKLIPEGEVTVIDDHGDLLKIPSWYFKFSVK